MTVCECGNPATTWLCPTCTGDLTNLLRGVPDLLTMLAITTAKQAKLGAGVRQAGPAGSLPPINLTSHLLEVTLDHLLRVGWIHTGHRPWFKDPVDAVEGIQDQMQALVSKQGVVTYYQQLKDTTERAWQVINGPEHRVVLGPCPVPECGTTLTITEADPDTVCPTCGVYVRVTAYRFTRVLEALGESGPQRRGHIIKQLSIHGVTVKPTDIDNWVARGKLRPVGVDEHRRHLYLVADVYRLAKTRAA